MAGNFGWKFHRRPAQSAAPTYRLLVAEQTTFNIHQGLEKIRAERALSVRQLHAIALTQLPALPQSRFSRFSLGYAHPGWAEVCALAKAFEVTPEQLAGLPAKSSPVAADAPAVPTPAPKATPPVTGTTPPAGGPVASAPAFPEPPAQVPERGSGTPEQYQALMGDELRKATQALHIPKLPAKLWAAWRAYEQALRRALLQQQRA